MKPKSARSLLLGLTLISTFTAHAAPLTWDNGDTTGNWNTTDLNWTATTWNNATPDDAIFDAAGVGPVVLTEAITAGSITINTAGYTIDTSTFGLTLNTGISANEGATIQSGVGGSLILGAANAWSVAATKTLAVSSGISGAFGITKSGSGTLDLSGANAYSGGINLSAGTVILGSATAPGSGTLTFDNGGTAPATAVFNSANTYTNPVTVAAGSTDVNTIQSTNIAGTLRLDGAVTINTGTTLKLDNSGSVFDIGTGIIGGNGDLEATGTSIGNFIFRGANTYSGGTILSGLGIFVPALNSTGPAGSPTNGPFGTGTLTLGNSTMRSTTIADTAIGNTLILAGNFTGSTNGSEKSLTFTGPTTLTGTRTINTAIGQTVSGKLLTFSGAIGDGDNDYGLTKQGVGTLALSGANTYSGDTTLDGGTVVISNATSFGEGDVLVTGASQITATFGLTYANPITVEDAALTLKSGTNILTNSPGGTATFSGVLSGSNTINVANSNTGNNTTFLDFTNPNNTFTGNIVGAAGNQNGADYFRFANIGDGGNFTFNKSGNRGGVTYNGSTNITFGTRQIALGTSFGGGSGGVGGGTTSNGLNGNGAPQNAFQNNANDPAHTVTFNTDMAMGGILSDSVFYFDGSNTGNNTFAGDIGNPTSGGNLSIGKWGAGKWILSGSNSFLGNVVIANGTLSVNTIEVAANNQSLGKGALIILGHANTSGTLEYTGSANTETNKQIVLGNLRNNNQSGAGGIFNNGDGTLTFSNPTFNSITGVTVTTIARTLTLGGTNTGANTISGTIQNNATGAAVALTKTGTGIWVLSGNNTYTGDTTITAGVLLANHTNAIASGSSINMNGDGAILGLGAGDFTRLPNFNATVGSGKITFTNNGGFAAYGADRIVNFGGANGIVAFGSSATPGVIGNMNGKALHLGTPSATHKVTVTNTLDLGGGSRTIQVNDGAAAIDGEISGVIQPQAGATTAGLNKTGTGTLALTAANTYTGDTTVSAGTLELGTTGQLKFLLGATSGTNNSLTGSGNATLNGSFVIDTTAADALASGTWTLENVDTLTGAYGSTFTVVDFTDAGSDKWTKVNGTKTYTFDETTGILTLAENVGGDPEIAVSQSGDIANGGSQGFGTVTIGSNAPLTFTITNTGTADLNLTGSPLVAVSGDPDFTVTAQPTTPVTSGGGTTTFTVQFAPSAVGVRNAVLTIANNDADEGTFTINVSGTGQTAYDAWSGGAPFGADANDDGTSNGMAFLLGASGPSGAVTLPTVTESNGDLVLNFTCLKIANRGTATLTLQYSRDLGISDLWTDNEVAVPDAEATISGVVFTVPSVNPDANLVNLQAAIPASEATPGTKLFGRLMAVKP